MATSLLWHGSAPRPRRTHFSLGYSRVTSTDNKGTTDSKDIAAGTGPSTEAHTSDWEIADSNPAHLSSATELSLQSPSATVNHFSASDSRTVGYVQKGAALATLDAAVTRKPLRLTEPVNENDVESLFRQELGQHPHFRGRGDWVRARFRRGTLRLSGTLPSFFLKQVAQAVAHRVPSVARVVNRIEVRDTIDHENRLESWNWKPGSSSKPGN